MKTTTVGLVVLFAAVTAGCPKGTESGAGAEAAAEAGAGAVADAGAAAGAGAGESANAAASSSDLMGEYDVVRSGAHGSVASIASASIVVTNLDCEPVANACAGSGISLALAVGVRAPAAEAAALGAAPEALVDGGLKVAMTANAGANGWSYSALIPMGTIPCAGGSAAVFTAVTGGAGAFGASATANTEACGELLLEGATLYKSDDGFEVRDRI